MKKLEIVELAVDPNDPQNLNKVLWCVHGHDAHPSVHCLKLKTCSGMSGHFVWGYSEWKRQPAFRTLGISLEAFMANKHVVLFFTAKEHALMYLSIILEPKKSALT